MKHFFSLLFAGLISSAFCFAQTNEERTPGDFSGLRVSGAISVILVQGDSYKVKVVAENAGDIKSVITTIDKDSILNVSHGKIKDDVKVYVTVKSLKKIEASGASNIKSENPLNITTLTVDGSGASNMKLQLNGGDVVVSLTGASSLKMTGTANNLTAVVSGASSLKGYELETQNASVNSSGSSIVKLLVKNSLKGDASGASSIKYAGEPKEKVLNVSGASSIKSVDSQTLNVPSDTTKKVKIGNNKFLVINDDDDDHCDDDCDDKKPDFNHWSGFGMGVSGYTDYQNKVKLPAGMEMMELDYARSLSYHLNFFEHDFHIYKNYVNLVTGLGLSWNNYAFRHPVTLNSDSSYTNVFTDSTINYRRNKLRTNALTLPLMIEFNTSSKPRHAFHIAAGVELSWIYSAKSIQEYDIEGYHFDVRKKDDYNLNPFRYSATVRAGYGDFTLFATAALNELFEKDKGARLFPFNVGIRIIPF